MAVLGFIGFVINSAFQLYMLAIVIYILMSWFPNAYGTAFGQFLTRLCEPYLRMFDFVPPFFGLSFGPLVGIIVLQLAQRGVQYLLTLL
ncbi:YggT family protein [Furfurilactobacillus sp. WILCCON 0119]|uniref:YggT family protein n=1 Tax=Furfurilactobacillus entadae TaxID=2922307 RepID=UPI0035EBB86E